MLTDLTRYYINFTFHNLPIRFEFFAKAIRDKFVYYYEKFIDLNTYFIL